MKAQKDQYDSYINRYGRTSIILMGICDSNTLFTYVFIGYPGSTHDSRVSILYFVAVSVLLILLTLPVFNWLLGI